MTTIIKSPGMTVAGLRKLYRDKLITAGSQYLFDFEDPYCNSFTRGTNLTAGNQFRDLVSGNPVGTVFGSSVANGAAGKGIRLPGINDHGVDFGVGYDTAQNAVLMIIWLMTRTGDTPSANSHIFGKNTSITVGQYFLIGGGTGTNPAMTFGLNGSLGASVTVGSALTVNTVEQYAFMWNGDTRTGWRNGVLQGTITLAGATMNSGSSVGEGLGRKTTAGSTAVFGFNTGWQGSIFRVYKENVTTYSADAATRLNWASAQVALDYQSNLARFS